MSGVELRVLFASWPDEEFLVAELWAGDAYVGDVRRGGHGRLFVALRPTDGSVDGIALGGLEAALASIRQRLAPEQED